MNKNIVFVFILIVSVLAQIGFKADSNNKKSGETKVQIWIDSMAPGPITVKQLLSAKIVRVTSPEGQNYKIKSFAIVFMPNRGASHFRNFAGNRLKGLEPGFFANASVGDHVLVSNFVIDNLPKYMPETQPMWTIIAGSK